MLKISAKISDTIVTVSNNLAKGIRYGYKGNNGKSPLYHLGRRPIGNFINKVYKDVSTTSSNDFIVDLGCGEGRFLKHAPRNRQWRFLGIDFDIDAIEVTRRFMHLRDKVILGDIVHLSDIIPREDQRNIKIVLAHRVLHGLPTEEQLETFREVARLLPSGGIFYVTVASAEDDWKAKALRDYYKYSQGTLNECKDVMFTDYNLRRDEPFLVNFLTKEACLRLITATGFKVVEQKLIYESSGYDHLKKKRNAYHAFKLVRL